MRILTLSTLFPASIRPNFGIFVERQTAALTAIGDVAVTVINPVGVAPWPLSQMGEQAKLRQLPRFEQWGELDVYRPHFTAIPKIGGRVNPAMIVSAILPLARKLHSDVKFDLIDAEFFYPDGPAAMRLSQALGIPFTIKARGGDIHHWGAQPGCTAQIVSAADGAAGLLAVSAALKADMVAMGMDAGKIRVHYTGLDQSRFLPRDRAVEKAKLDINGPLILCVGALIPRKGQDLLIAALPLLPDAKLLLAGAGESERDFRALALELGVADRVAFLGNVPHDDLPALFAAADIMALVSASEGLANAWVEALACGTPIIASDVGGIRELVKTPAAGRIVDRTPQAVADAARDILANPPARDAVAANVSAFSWDENARQLAAFFRDVVR
ncbi:glycosyltransferase family 4 protein [Sphingorhabdus sp. IMCC26285]|uniref:Glycosyltransferase family 4 protein n=1 Tax=Sphingorhabdus profundilacus TaxID=2509718 RepID=A0A6I4LSP2_9SPHN|nr:glycosyltransferase family 4 protein [Sphingorhabdus profundilacus]